MKLAELIQEHDVQIRLQNEAEVALKMLDWNFDVDGMNDSRFSRGAKAMQEAEKMVGKLYQVSPDSATQLWGRYCPYAMPGFVPATVRCA